MRLLHSNIRLLLLGILIGIAAGTTQWCKWSSLQTCEKSCKRTQCPHGQCATRVDDCCKYNCHVPCTRLQCQQGKKFTTCGSRCTPTCKDKDPTCTDECVQKCECPYPSVFSKRQHKCVEKCECPVVKCHAPQKGCWYTASLQKDSDGCLVEPCGTLKCHHGHTHHTQHHGHNDHYDDRHDFHDDDFHDDDFHDDDCHDEDFHDDDGHDEDGHDEDFHDDDGHDGHDGHYGLRHDFHDDLHELQDDLHDLQHDNSHGHNHHLSRQSLYLKKCQRARRVYKSALILTKKTYGPYQSALEAYNTASNVYAEEVSNLDIDNMGTFLKSTIKEVEPAIKDSEIRRSVLLRHSRHGGEFTTRFYETAYEKTHQAYIRAATMLHESIGPFHAMCSAYKAASNERSKSILADKH